MLSVRLPYFPEMAWNFSGAHVITASNAGFDYHPAWFFNLKSDPQVTIQVKEVEMTTLAEQVEGELRSQLWEQLIEKAPG
jgi:deazaflavin-dependent oxidoreductase (nitroreductase family)